LALAWSGAYAVAAVATLIVLVRRIGSLRDAGLAGATSRSALATVVLALVAAPLGALIGHDSPGQSVVAVAVAGGLGVLAYLGVLVALRSDDVVSLFASLRQRRATPSDVYPLPHRGVLTSLQPLPPGSAGRTPHRSAPALRRPHGRSHRLRQRM
jgi:hypothetical protein